MSIACMALLSQAAVDVVLSQLGQREQGRNNCGPAPRKYLASVGLGEGFSWCAAFAFWCFLEASLRIGVRNPCPRTAKAVQMFAQAPAECRDSNPSVGAIYVLDHGQPGNVLTEWKCGRYTDNGHAGVVVCINDTDAPIEFELPAVVVALIGLPAGKTSVTVPPGQMAEVSGNTNALGSREGNAVAIHVGPSPEVIHGGVLLGYIQLDLAQAPAVA